MDSKRKKHLPFEFKTIFWLFVALALWQVVSLLSLPKSQTEASDLTLENILQAVSAERTSRNLGALNTDSRLSQAAQYKSDDMMARRYFSHTDPEGNYIWGKIVEKGYTPYLQLGENLAIEFYNTESLVSAWMNSPTHRANVLNEGFKDQGMGLAFGTPSQGQYYSSIANTFGVLVPAKKPAAPPAPKPKPPAQTPTPPPQVAAAENPPAPTPAPIAEEPKPQAIPPTPAPETQTTIPGPATTTEQAAARPPSEPLRSGVKPEETKELAQDFALPEQNPVPGSSTPETASPEAVSPPVLPKQGLSAYEVNRYIMLGFGIILFLMIASDIKKMFEEKFHAYDKKINNLVLLILTLVVIGFMYWL